MNANEVIQMPAALSRTYASLRPVEGESFFSTVERALELCERVSTEELQRVPVSGPLIVVANHPFGAAEGIVLARVLSGIRSDVKVLANYVLGQIPELRESLILVDPFRPGASSENVRGLRRAIDHLQRGGALVVFPAGTVSHFQPGPRRVTDPRWNVSVARLARRTRSTVLPVYFPGANGPLFQLAGLLHPSLRTALLPQALLDSRRKTIEMRIGQAMPFARLAKFGSDEALTAHLRRKTYVLAHRTAPGIARPIPAALMQREIDALPAEAKLASNGDLDVYIAGAEEIRDVLLEIGRLREVTFRAVGEGSGQPRDLDTYDSFYRHLFIWNRASREVAGAYRLGLIDEIVARYGPSGLYTSTLFRYSPRFFEAVGRCSIELGRSFIRAEYQKSYTPLLLLWKGIAGYVARNPRYCVLFGPASISNDFHPQSRALMASYLMRHAAARDMMSLVAPRHAFRVRPDAEIADELDALEDLQELIAEIEAGQRSIPVLLRQYLNLGGRVAAMNVDPKFCDALDALVLVDLRKTDAKALSRYMGAGEYRAFQAYHAKNEPL